MAHAPDSATSTRSALKRKTRMLVFGHKSRASGTVVPRTRLRPRLLRIILRYNSQSGFRMPSRPNENITRALIVPE